MIETSKSITLIEELLELEQNSLTMETLLDDIDEFDSMAKLSLIVMIDEECDKILTGDDIKNFKTIADVVAFMG